MKYTMATCESDFAIIKKLNNLSNPETYWENAIKILGISEEQARKSPLAYARYREIDKNNLWKTFPTIKIDNNTESRPFVYTGAFGTEIDAFNLADIKTDEYSLCVFDDLVVVVSCMKAPSLHEAIRFSKSGDEFLLKASNEIIKQYIDELISYVEMKLLWREELLKRAEAFVSIFDVAHY